MNTSHRGPRKERADLPRQILAAAARRIPTERSEWGAALLAELDHLHDTSARWRFALGGARVALFPPLPGASATMTKRSAIANLGLAALVGAVTVLPFAVLESVNNTVTLENVSSLAALFGLLWLLPTACVLVSTPLLRAVRAGESVLAHRHGFFIRIVVVALMVAVWGAILADQLPCFLGMPNCD